MAFRASNVIPQKGYDDARLKADALKKYAGDLKALSLAGPVSANQVIDFYLNLIAADTTFAAVAAIPGMVAYARDQEDDPTYDVAAEFTAMRSQVQACRDWIIANFPTGAGSRILKDQLTTTGIVVRTFATAELAGLRTQIDLLTATIS